jgi:hypothetical protein
VFQASGQIAQQPGESISLGRGELGDDRRLVGEMGGEQVVDEAHAGCGERNDPPAPVV